MYAPLNTVSKSVLPPVLLDNVFESPLHLRAGQLLPDLADPASFYLSLWQGDNVVGRSDDAEDRGGGGGARRQAGPASASHGRYVIQW
jgi:hypothetical protein